MTSLPKWAVELAAEMREHKKSGNCENCHCYDHIYPWLLPLQFS